MSDNEGSPKPPQDVKPKADDNTLNIKIVSTDGNEVFFKIKKTTRLNKLKVNTSASLATPSADRQTVDLDARASGAAYADRVGADVNALRLLFDGKRIMDEETAQDLDLEEGDAIEVLLEHRPLVLEADDAFLEVGGC
ncbi:hypothetical protein JCM24511_01147 [Saitozyma sp. JCM 24511]|nr:hypothetical protein JCM24511_01147 [Saitozyma sp. JCM 24511]